MRFAENVDLSEEAQAFDALHEVGPGNHFLGCAHTQAQLRDRLLPARSWPTTPTFEQWSAEGSLWEHQDRAAKTRWRQMLKDYEKPPMDEATDEALLAYMAKRREEIGAG